MLEPGSYPIRLKRDLRVASPQPLYRALTDFLEDQHLHVVVRESPELEASALPGTASFQGRLLGLGDFTPGAAPRPRGVIRVAGGAALVAVGGLIAAVSELDIVFPILGAVVGLVLVITGVGRLRRPLPLVRLRRMVDIRLEGESYQAGAARATSTSLEPGGLDLRIGRRGIVSDVRLTVHAGVGYPDHADGVSQWLPEQEAEVSEAPLEAPPSLQWSGPEGPEALPAGSASNLPVLRLRQYMDRLAERFDVSERET